ncbi:hypothetical protein AB4175_10535 [Vibrio cyclitrophicus]
MNIQDGFLNKLRLEAYSDREMNKFVGSVETMYNPDSLLLNYRTDYVAFNSVNSDIKSNTFRQAQPGTLDVELLFDSRMPENRWCESIEAKVAKLKLFCNAINSETNEPHFLSVSWGKLPMGSSTTRDFLGRATNLSINYTLFERNGAPVRAVARITLVEDRSLLLQRAQEILQAPILKVLSVGDKATMSQLAHDSQATGEGEVDYLSLAQNNDLNSLRDLEAGQTLLIERTRS